MVPIRFGAGDLARPSPADIAEVTGQIAALRGGTDGYDMVVWAELAVVARVAAWP